MKTFPTISVIVPVYNTEKYVERCIKSITEQSFTDIEVVCVDDASSDGSYKILERLAAADKRIGLHRNNTNHGAGYTKNKALDCAVGDYVCFVDSDDWMTEGALKFLHESAVIHNADDVFYLNYGMTEGSDRLLSFVSTTWKKFPESDMYSGLQFLEAMLDNKCITIGAVHHFVRRSILQANGVSFSDVRLLDDFQFSCNLLVNAKKVLFVKKELYVYFHRNSGSISNTPKSITLANNLTYLAMLEYQSMMALDDDFVRRVARKLLRRCIAGIRNDVIELPKTERQYFMAEIFAESKYSGVYFDLTKESIAKLRNDTLYIFGAGNYAIDLYRQLWENGIDIEAFIVTRPTRQQLAGKQILSITDFSVPQNATLIIGTSEKYYDEILKTEKVNWFSKVLLYSELTKQGGG